VRYDDVEHRRILAGDGPKRECLQATTRDRKVIARDRITAGGCEFSPTVTIARIGLVALRKGELVRDEIDENAAWVEHTHEVLSRLSRDS
jgi:hypothetical protein